MWWSESLAADYVIGVLKPQPRSDGGYVCMVQVGDSLAAEYVAGRGNSKAVVSRLWREDPPSVVRAMGLLLHREPTGPVLSRILQLSKVKRYVSRQRTFARTVVSRSP